MFCQTTIALLLEELPSEISAAERGTCLQEFERSRSYLIFQFTLKLSPYMEPPLLLYGLTHFMRSKHIWALRILLTSKCQHPKVLELTSTGELNTEALLFLEGAPLDVTPRYALFRGCFRFAFSGERLGEAGHAMVHLRALRGRCRTEAFDSLSNRMDLLKNSLNEPSYMVRLLDALTRGRSPGMLCRELHLQHHPSIKRFAKGDWDPIHRKVIYHNDVLTLYARKRPAISHSKLPPPPPTTPGAPNPSAPIPRAPTPGAQTPGAPSPGAPTPGAAQPCTPMCGPGYPPPSAEGLPGPAPPLSLLLMMMKAKLAKVWLWALFQCCLLVLT